MSHVYQDCILPLKLCSKWELCIKLHFWVGWYNLILKTYIWKGLGLNLGQDTGYRAVFCGIFHSVQGIARLVPHLGDDWFITNHFQFIIYQLSIHSMLYSLATESVIK
jgi:hypothetical protein